MKRIHTAFLLATVGVLSSIAAFAQVGATVGAASRTDVAVSLYGAFSGTTTGNGAQQSPANSAGGLLEVRYIKNPIFGLEGAYAFNHADRTYNSLVSPPCPTGSTCTSLPASIKANAHEVTGDWVVSLKVANLRPFALAGGGLLLNVPSSGQTNTGTSTKPVFVYGGGLDWGLLPHLGLRLQYRGNLYHAPNLDQLFNSTGTFTHTAEPTIGVYFRL
jgi:opacity protein-like surface antigen